MRKALSYFQVSRSFAGIKEPAKLAFVTRSLQKVREAPSLSSPLEKVNKLAEVLKGKFDQSNISAASKLLWLSYRCPFIISNSRATKALKRDFRHKHADESYEEFVKAWRNEYTKHEGEIEKAVKALSNGRCFMRKFSASDADLMGMVQQPWFMERVFDVLLWDIGQS